MRNVVLQSSPLGFVRHKIIAATRFTSRHAGPTLLLLALPWLLIALNDSWTYLAPLGYVDPYIYTGYFLGLKEYLDTFGGCPSGC
jgi:hypothetical protein